MTTLLGPPGIEIGEPGAFVNNGSCVVLVAFPDWHELNKRSQREIATGSIAGRLLMPRFKVVSFLARERWIEKSNH
ncbi:MAG: hypothetical protein ABR555_05245 [Pyrinomonadaceae bacterium]